MKVGLLGAGRIGRLHARLLRGTPGIDELVVADADAGARRRGGRRDVGSPPRPRSPTRSTTADAVVIAAATSAHAELVPRRDRRGLPTFCEKPLAADLDATIAVAAEIERSGDPLPARLPAPLRPGLPRGPPAGRERRARHAVRRPAGRPRPGAAARVLHPAVGRAVPRFLDPRLRHPSLAERPRGRGGLCRRRRPGVPGLREVRRRRYGGRDPAAVGRHAGRADRAPATTRSATTSGPSCSARATRVSVGLGPRTPMRSVEPGVPPPAGPAWPDFLDPLRVGLCCRIRRLRRGRARRSPRVPCTAQDGVEALRIAEAADRSLHEHRPVRLEEIPG